MKWIEYMKFSYLLIPLNTINNYLMQSLRLKNILNLFKQTYKFTITEDNWGHLFKTVEILSQFRFDESHMCNFITIYFLFTLYWKSNTKLGIILTNKRGNWTGIHCDKLQWNNILYANFWANQSYKNI